MKRLRILAWLWVGVLLLTGGIGGLVMSRVGWSLAMALAIYGGNTEPAHPDLAYPWLLFALAALVALGGLAWGFLKRKPEAQPEAPSLVARLLPLVLAYGGGLVAAVLPFVQLYRLWVSVG